MRFGCRHTHHKVTSLTVGADAVNMTVTNSTNISSLDDFDLLLCVNPDLIVTGAPLPYTITINGTAVPLVNKYKLPIYTNRLQTRVPYCGAYVEEASGVYVILFDTPSCSRFAKP